MPEGSPSNNGADAAIGAHYAEGEKSQGQQGGEKSWHNKLSQACNAPDKKSTQDLKLVLHDVMPGRDNADISRKLAARMERAGLSMPGVEVRFQNLNAEAVVPRSSTGISTMWSSAKGIGRALVSACVPEPKRRIPMLNEISGVLKPGRMTLLLGPPGAGKTTLLRTLAGQMSDNKSVQFTGNLTYNGLVPGEDFVVERTAAYVDQVDQHTPEMTVQETLNFASQTLGPGASKELHKLIKDKEAALGITPDPAVDAAWEAAYNKGESIIVPMFARLLGIEHVMDTVVGDQQLKGISGGQKRRVTVGEGSVGLASCMFLDEASTGLDSATTFQIVQAMRNMCVHTQTTYVISLLQPAPEVYDLFDDIMVMAERRIVFHGPREAVLPFFEKMGFICPKVKPAPDFLQEVVTTTDQEKYWNTRHGAFRQVIPKKMTRLFHESETGQAMLATLDSPPYTHELQHFELTKQEYALSWWQEFIVVGKREALLATKKVNMFFAMFNVVETAFTGFIVATTFPRLPTDDYNNGNLFMSVLFLSVMTMIMNGFNFAPLFTRRLPVFFKQRAMRFHGVWSWVISGTLVRLPEITVCSVVWSIIIYFSVGFYLDVGRFFIFFLVIFGQAWMGVTMFSFMGALTRNDTLAQGIGAVVCLVFIATSGFTIARQSIGGWLIWLYWLNPSSWAIRAIAINEMTSPNWSKSAAPYGPADQKLGDFVLTSRGFYTEWGWVWAGIGFELGYALLFMVLEGVALMYLGPHIETNQQESSNPHELSSGDSVIIRVGSGHLQITDPKNSCVPPIESPRPVSGVEMATRQASQTQEQGTLPFDRMTLAFKGVDYFVPKPNTPGEELQLLHDCYGTFRPGVLTALMGASGAGKTTLMDVLAGRKNAGRALGSQTLNGHPKDMKTFARVMGYVEQLDVHVPQATVKEAMVFSARLRLDSSISMASKMAFVDEVMELVELDPVSDRLVTTLSIEARKRLTIGVELVANPSVLFADEPTSGLDSRAALVVMRALRNIVNTGRTVVCTIHQPSTEIFTAFDELLLLKPGGYVIYNGELGKDGASLINYLTAFPGVKHPEPAANPSVYMLEVTDPSAEKEAGLDWAKRWADSAPAKLAIEQAERLCQPLPGTQPLSFDSVYAVSYVSQFITLVRRNLITYWRMPEYNVLRLGAAVGLGVFLGLLYLNCGGETTSLLGLLNILGAIYSITLFLGIINALSAQPVVANERPAFYREKASGFYSAVCYSMAQGMAEVPYLITQGLIYTVIVYYMIGFVNDSSKFWWFYLFNQLSLCCFTFFGMAAMHLAPALPIATNCGAFFIIMWDIFCGFLLYKDDIYGWWIWWYYFNPLTYALYGIITTQLGDVWDENVIIGPGISMPVAQYVNQTYGYKYDFRGWCVLILFGFVIAFRAISLVGCKYLNYQKR